MAYSLYYSDVTDTCLAICIAASACKAKLKPVKVANELALPGTVALPLPSAGLPALVTPSSNVLQVPAAAVKAIGALHHFELCRGCTPH